MQVVEVNMLAVLATTIFSMVLGSIWYAKPVFGKAWMALVGMTDEKAKQGALKAMLLMLLGAFLTQYVFAHVIEFSEAVTALEGLQGGFFMWLGFVAAVSIAQVGFEQRPVKLWAINSGYQFVNLLVSGVILTLWQ